jgi:hypothetical protein
MRKDMFNKRFGPFSNNAGVESWSRTRALIVILNLAIAASLYLVPLIFGYAWNNSAGPSILNVRQEDRRYPATNITAEPWGASVLLGPAESRLREYFSGRNLPLWNPYQGLGEPYAAQADGSPYSLPTLARALLPPWAGNLITFAVFAISGAGMFAFLSLIGLSKEIRFFGALAVFLSTALTFHIARYNIADQNALIPIQFAVTTWAIQRRTPLTYLALAAVTAVTITAGFVQTAVITIAVTSLFGMALIWVTYRSWRERSLIFSAIIAATLVGLALSAPFWLPIAEVADGGYHKNVPSVVVYRPPPYNLAAFFFPALFGDTLALTSLGGAGNLIDWHNLFATSSAVVLLLCFIGLFACKWDDRGHRLLFSPAAVCVAILVLRFMHWPPFSLLSRDTVLAQQTTKHTQAVAAFLALFAAMLALEHHRNWVHSRLNWVCIGFVSIPVIVFCFAGITSGDPIRALVSPLPFVAFVNTVVLALVCAVIFQLSQRRVVSPVPLFVTVVGVIICAELTLYLPFGTEQWWISCVRLLLGIAWVSACYLLLIDRYIIAATLAATIIACYSAIVALPKQGLPTQVYSRAIPAFAEFLRTRIGNDYRSFGIFPNFSSQAAVRDIGVVERTRTHRKRAQKRRVFNADIVENGVNSQPRNRAAARINLDGGLTHVPHGCVGDEQLASAGALFGNAARRAAEIAVDQAVFYEDRAAGNDGSAGDADSDQAGVDAIEIEVAQAHGLSHVRLREAVEGDVDAVGPGVKDGSEHLVAIDGDRFGDCHRAEAAGVKAVDLAVDGGLGDGAGERLARRGATARIGIIAHSRDPGAGRLGVNGRGLQEEHERRRYERERSLTHGALRPERAAGGWRIRSATA